jgi:hypothetical protein
MMIIMMNITIKTCRIMVMNVYENRNKFNTYERKIGFLLNDEYDDVSLK